MKNQKLMKILQQLFVFGAYTVLVIASVKLVGYNYQILSDTDALSFYQGIADYKFDLVFELREFVRMLTRAFFLLLIGSIFSTMRNGGKPRNAIRNQRILNVTCAGFLIEGFLSAYKQLASSLVALPYTLRLFEESLFFCIFAVLSEVIHLTFALTPTLYALSVFILYRHFNQLAEFEADVA